MLSDTDISEDYDHDQFYQAFGNDITDAELNEDEKFEEPQNEEEAELIA